MDLSPKAKEVLSSLSLRLDTIPFRLTCQAKLLRRHERQRLQNADMLNLRVCPVDQIRYLHPDWSDLRALVEVGQRVGHFLTGTYEWLCDELNEPILAAPPLERLPFRFDAAGGTLFFRDDKVATYRPKSSAAIILQNFQLQGWPEMIRLPSAIPGDVKQMVARMNAKISDRPIRFRWRDPFVTIDLGAIFDGD